MSKDSVQEKRVRKLKEELDDKGLKGVVLVPGPNMRYYTGVSSLMLERPFMLLVSVDGDPHLVAPTLEAGPYADCAVRMKVHPWTDSEGSGGAIAAAVRGAGMKGRWGVEGRVPFLFLDRLMKKASPRF